MKKLLALVWCCVCLMPAKCNEPPSGPPVITGYSPGRQPENGDILVCTVTGGSPLVDVVLFSCHTPLLLDQNDIRNQTSVSSSITLNSSQATVDSLVCVCTALWAPGPQQYTLAASVMYPVPPNSTTTSPPEHKTKLTTATVTAQTTTDRSKTSQEDSTRKVISTEVIAPIVTENDPDVPVAVIAGSVGAVVFIIILLVVLLLLGRNGHLACFRRDYDVTKVPETITDTSSAFTDSANDGPSTGQEGNTAENGQHQTNYSGQERHKNDTHLDTSVYENCAQPELGAHAYMNCPSQSARNVPDITITYYEGDYASVDVATGDDGTEYAKPYLYASVSKAPGEKQTSSNMSAQENKHTPTRKTITGPLGDVYAVPSK